MNHADIETLAKNWVVDAADRPANPRVQQVVLRLLGDLCKAIEDLDISPPNSGTAFPTCRPPAPPMNWACCRRPGPGALPRHPRRRSRSSAPAWKAARRAPSKVRCTWPARRKASASRAWTTAPRAEQAEVLFMQGTVFDQDGKPLPGAKVEVWHANLMGNYSFFDKTQSPLQPAPHHRHRRKRPLPVPAASSEGLRLPAGRHHPALLDLLGRHGQRPAHIHFFVSAPATAS
jgi:catechol 1,2-dioxygenase